MPWVCPSWRGEAAGAVECRRNHVELALDEQLQKKSKTRQGRAPGHGEQRGETREVESSRFTGKMKITAAVVPTPVGNFLSPAARNEGGEEGTGRGARAFYRTEDGRKPGH